MKSTFNPDLYAASREALIDNGVPPEVAEAASIVAASDDGSKSDFGRSAEDQQIVQDAVKHMHDHWGKNS